MNECVVIQPVCASGSNYPVIFIIERDPRLLRRPLRVPSELVSKFPVLKQLCRQLVQLVPSHVPPLPADRRVPLAWQGIVSGIRKASGVSLGPRSARALGRIAELVPAAGEAIRCYTHLPGVALGGAVICWPLFFEASENYRAEILLADALVAHGLAAQRFDYRARVQRRAGR